MQWDQKLGVCDRSHESDLKVVFFPLFLPFSFFKCFFKILSARLSLIAKRLSPRPTTTHHNSTATRQNVPGCNASAYSTTTRSWETNDSFGNV